MCACRQPLKDKEGRKGESINPSVRLIGSDVRMHAMEWTAASDVCFLSQFLLKQVQVLTGDARARRGEWVRRNKVTIDAKTRIDKGGNTTV